MSWKDLFKKAVDAMPEDAADGKPDGGPQFSEADVAARVKAAGETAAAKAKAEAAAEFAEAQARERAEADKARIKAFIDEGVKAGRITPAMRDAGLAQFLESLVPGGEIEFSEGRKQDGLSWFLDFAAKWPTVIEFGEIATRDKDVKAGGNAGEKLERLVRDKLGKAPGKSYQIAFSEAQAENPELAREYATEIM